MSERISAWEYRYGVARPGTEHAGGRNLDRGVEAVQVGREAAHHAETDRPPVRRRPGGQRRPGQRTLGGDGVHAMRLEAADELIQQPAGVGELESQRPAQVQIVGQRVGQRRSWRAHGVSPGQGRASWRSAWMSTLAYIAVVSGRTCRSVWPISVNDPPERSMAVAAECRSRWAPITPSPARRPAQATTVVTALEVNAR